MLRSSLGFHTMTLCISLLNSETDKLLIDFSTYRANTGLIQMYIKDEKGDPIIYYHNSPYIPSELNIYFKDRHRGIQWYIRTPEGPFSSFIYIVEAKINPKFLAGITDYLTAAIYYDMNCAIANFNDACKISPLLQTFSDYKITRIDYCVNIALDEIIPGYNPDQIMNLIKRSDIPPHYEEWMKYDKTSHRMKSRPESFYLKSKSVNINYYSKYLQLLNQSDKNVEKGHDPIDQEILDASRNIYRFEVQYKYHKIYSLSQELGNAGDLSYNKYKNLLTPVKCIDIVSDYYKKTIGKGDWYSLSEAVQIIQSKNFNSQREKRYIDALKYISHCRSLAKAKKTYPKDQLMAFNKTLKELSDLNINPVTIPREWNIKHMPNLLKAYFNTLMATSCDYSMENMETIFTANAYMEYCKMFKHPPI